MRNESPSGLLLTWTTYGSWLHGDERGSYDRKGQTFETHYVAPNPSFENLRRSQLKFLPLLLDAAMRKAVRLAIEECCIFRNWKVFAVHVRTNHVHVAMPNCESGEKMLHDFKSYATRKLRALRLIARGRSVWTSGGSVSRLYGEAEVFRAIDYVKNGQGDLLPEADPPN
jgi:REP element-mobilizing transposase RayT